MKPTFGETVKVIGLGLVGLMVQLLQANGCHVIGIDKTLKDYWQKILELMLSIVVA